MADDSAWASVLETGLRNLGYRTVRLMAANTSEDTIARTLCDVVVVDLKVARSRRTAWARAIASVHAGATVFVIGGAPARSAKLTGVVDITSDDPAADVLRRLLDQSDRA